MGGEISGRKCAWSFSHAGFTMHLQVTHFLNVRHVEERERQRERERPRETERERGDW